MKNIMSFKTASNLCIILYALLILFHIIVVTGGGVLGVIPHDVVWGGRIPDRERLLVTETVSLAVTSVFLVLTLIKAGRLKVKALASVSHYAMWVLFVYFLVNTAANLASKTLFEKSMAVFSLLLALGSLRLAFEKKSMINRVPAVRPLPGPGRSPCSGCSECFLYMISFSADYGRN